MVVVWHIYCDQSVIPSGDCGMVKVHSYYMSQNQMMHLISRRNTHAYTLPLPAFQLAKS